MFLHSMVTTHAYPNSREAVLPVWTGEAQARRQAPDASLTALFVHIHGMLFTKIQLDDFKPILARFEEKLVIEGASASRFSSLFRADHYARTHISAPYLRYEHLPHVVMRPSTHL